MILQTELPSARDIMEITPYNAAGYGLALLVLIIAVWSIYKLYTKEREYGKKRSESLEKLHIETVKHIELTNIRLQDQEGMHDTVKEIDRNVKTILKST